MRKTSLRIPPLPASEWDEEQRQLMAPVIAGKGLARGVLNIFATLIRHPKLYKRWAVFGNHTLFKSSLGPRERELVILRTAWLAGSPYEWGQHLSLGRDAGLTDAEMDAIRIGPGPDGWSGSWSEGDCALLTGTDELFRNTHISDSTWRRLNALFSERQVMDFVFTVGQYNMLAMALNSFGVQLDDHIAAAEANRSPR